MKKIGLLMLAGFLVFGSLAFAAEGTSPAEIYGNLTGKTSEEAWQMRSQGRFGELAAEEGVSEAFVAQMLEVKKVQIQALVGDTLTQDQADELIAELEARIAECDGTQSQAQLLQGLGMRFGNGQGAGMGNHPLNGQGYGMGRGMGNRRGNGGFGRGLQDGTGFRAQDGSCLLQ